MSDRYDGDIAEPINGHDVEWYDGEDVTIPHYKCKGCRFPFLSRDDLEQHDTPCPA